MKICTSNLRTSLLNAALLTAVSQITPLQADLYWDTNGASPGAGDTSANWDTGYNWTTDPDGGIPQTSWTDGENAVFSAGTDGTAFTATVTGFISTPSITFEEAGNTVTVAGGVINIGGGMIDSSALGIAAGRNVVISSELAGAGGLTIQSHGDLSPSGGGGDSELDLTGPNTFTGNLTITSGLVGWNTDASFGDFDNTITLDGGGLVDTNRNLTLYRDVIVGAGGGTLRAYGNANTILEGDITGSGELNKTDGGGITFPTSKSFTGTLNVLGGSARIGDGETGDLANASAINIGSAGALWIRRTDAVNTSALLPATVTFAAAGSLIEFNPPSELAAITLDQDLGSSTTLGAMRVSGGSLTLAPGTDVAVSTVLLGLQNAANRGVLNIGPGSTLAASFFDLGQTGGGSGTVNQTGGVATVVAGGNGFRIGHWNNNANPGSVYNLSGGTLDATALSANGTASAQLVNIGWDGQADMIVGGGDDIATLKAFGIQLDANGDSATYSDNLTLSPNGRIEVGGGNIASASVNDRLLLNGGTLAATANTLISAATTANPGTTTTVDANGSVLSFTGELAGTGTLDLIDSVGTGVIDINSGTGTRTVAANLAGTATLTKGGSGTLALTGSSTHSGDFYVNAGTLNLGGSINSALTDINGSTLRGEGSLGGDLFLGFSSAGTLVVDPVTPGALSVAGDVTLNGTNTLALTTPFSGTVTALTYGGTLTGGAANLALPGQANYRGFSVDTATHGTIKLVNNGQALTWTGTGGGVWDLNANSAWVNGGTNTFFWGDTVRFDNSSAVGTVALAGELSPFGIVVDSTSDYTFNGSAGNFISGIGSLLKKGGSTLTVDAPNTYSGGTVISAGTVQVRQAGALGTGPVVLGDAATGSSNVALYLDTNRVNFGTQVHVSNNGTGTATLGSRATVGGSGDNNQFTNIVLGRNVIFDSNAADRTDYENITGTGNITVNGAGRSNFVTSPALWTGDLTVNATGGLQVGVASTAGDRIPDSSNLTINSGAFVRLSTAAETIAGLNGTGTLSTNSPSGGTAILTVGTGDANGTFTGPIDNGNAILGLTKVGLGTQTITGAKTHTGRTTVTAGKLAIDGETSLGNAPAALVADQLLMNGGTLKAIGSVTIDDANRGITTTAPGATFEADAAQTLAIVSPMTGEGAVTKTGDGLMTSTGGSWTGVTTISAGTLQMLAKAGISDYVVHPGATLKLDYNVPQGAYSTSVTVHGAGVTNPTGLQLLGGRTLNIQRNSALRLATAPSTVRTYGGGTSTLQGHDINFVHLTVDAEASGSIIAGDVNIDSGSFGYRLNVTPGANTASGDLFINGNITGAGSVDRAGFQVNIQKYGAGSVQLNGVGSYPEGIWIREGSLILGGDNRLAPTAGIAFGDGAVSSTLVMNGAKQTVSDIGHHNGNLASRIIGGSSTRAVLTVDYNGAGRVFSGDIGGTTGHDGNLAIVKSGAGPLTLQGLLDYTGDTTVQGGILTLPMASLADSSNVSISGNGQLDLTHGDGDTVNALVFDGVPQAAGTWGSSDSGAANIDDSRFSGTGMLVVTTSGNSYMIWESANNIGGAGADTDSDGDGIANGIEFVLGTDPDGTNNLADLPTLGLTPDGLYADFVFRRSDLSMAMPVDQRPYVQFGSDLDGWTTAVHDGVNVIITEAPGPEAGVQLVTVRILRSSVDGGVRMFARLRADIP